MSVVDIQRVLALILYTGVGLVAFRYGCKIRWVQIRGTLHTITAICLFWVLFTIAASGTAAFVKSDTVVEELGYSLWLLTFLEGVTAAGLGLIVFLMKSLADTQERAIANLKQQGFETHD